MPGYDGQGPRGQGPMTGGGMGYCMLKLPGASDEPLTGFAGLVGRPLRFRSDLSTADLVTFRLILRRIQLALQDIERRLSALESVR